MSYDTTPPAPPGSPLRPLEDFREASARNSPSVSLSPKSARHAMDETGYDGDDLPCHDDYLTPLQSLVLIVRLLLVLYCSVAMLLFTLPLVLLLLPLSLAAFRTAINCVVVPLWINCIVNIFPPMAATITGERIDRILQQVPPNATQRQIKSRIMSSFDSTKLVIANHTIDSDFLIIWLLLPLLTSPASTLPLLSSFTGNLKIVLKNELAALPIVGHGMKAFEFLFLSRNIAHDRANLTTHFSQYLQTTPTVSVLIFPEGTTLNTKDAAKSRSYAQSKPLPLLPHSNLLYPRVTGFNLLSKSLLATAPTSKLLDLTLVYNGYNTDVPSFNTGYGRNVDRRVMSVKKLLVSYNVWGLQSALWGLDNFLATFTAGGGGVSVLYKRSHDVTVGGRPVVLCNVEETALSGCVNDEAYLYNLWQEKDRFVEATKNDPKWWESRGGDVVKLKDGRKGVTLDLPNGSLIVFWATLLFPFFSVFWYCVFLLFGGAFVVVGVNMYATRVKKEASIQIFGN